MVGRRLALLLACSALGAGIGAVGQWLTGDGRWYLALPAVIALGWLFVADPTRCQPPPGGALATRRTPPRRRTRGREPATEATGERAHRPAAADRR